MCTLHSAVLHPSLILCFVYERLLYWQCPKIPSLYNFLRNLPTSLPRKLLPFSKHHKVLKYYNIASPLRNYFQFFRWFTNFKLRSTLMAATNKPILCKKKISRCCKTLRNQWDQDKALEMKWQKVILLLHSFTHMIHFWSFIQW